MYKTVFCYVRAPAKLAALSIFLSKSSFIIKKTFKPNQINCNNDANFGNEENRRVEKITLTYIHMLCMSMVLLTRDHT